MKTIIRCYIKAKECVNAEAMFSCLKCGKCGRVFNEVGVLMDEGDTHPMDAEDEE